MQRREFVKLAGLFGLSLPLQTLLSSCKKPSINPDFEGNVLIVGAGAAGIAAGYYLSQQGIDFQILEAQDRIGGRLKTDHAFADFPIPLGGEWLHTDPEIFATIVNDPGVSVSVPTVGYQRSDTFGEWRNGELELTNLGRYNDRKFVNSSWLGFLETYLLPTVAPQIQLNTVVESIEYGGEGVRVMTTDGQEFSATHLILTVPLKLLQEGTLTFSPALPDRKTDAINDALVWPGLKVFLEFSSAFYPTMVEFEDSRTKDGDRVYYDAAYGQATNRHILGLFAVGKQAEPYLALNDLELKVHILTELDAIFDGQATDTYLKHLVQNWSADPFARGTYLQDYESSRRVYRLQEPVAEKLYFAGEAYTSGKDWGGAHNAITSAMEAVEALLAS